MRLRPQRLVLAPFDAPRAKLDIEAARDGQHLPALFGAANAMQMAAPTATLPPVDILGGAYKLNMLSSATSICLPAAFTFATAVSKLGSATRSSPGLQQLRMACMSIAFLQSNLARSRFVLLAHDSDHLAAPVGIAAVALVCNVLTRKKLMVLLQAAEMARPVSPFAA